MSKVFSFRPADHDEVQALLPWYATGAVDAADRARVETHMAGCAQCQADLAIERRLAGEISGLSMAAEDGWTALRPRLQARAPRRGGAGIGIGQAAGRFAARLRRGWKTSPAWVGWALAAQACIVVAVAVLPASLTQSRTQPGRYKALGAAPAPPTANLVVIFRPDTREADLRAAVRATGGRLVGGPTEADAYLLSVPSGSRMAALGRLRARPDIALAEPIDAGAAP